MRRIHRAAIITFFLLAGAGCHEEGPAERAGRAIDDAAREAGDKVRDLGGEEGTLERAGRNADEEIEKMKKALE